MPVSNLARVFGPTIVGHNCPDPDPMQMLSDTKTQPAVSLIVILSYCKSENLKVKMNPLSKGGGAFWPP